MFEKIGKKTPRHKILEKGRINVVFHKNGEKTENSKRDGQICCFSKKKLAEWEMKKGTDKCAVFQKCWETKKIKGTDKCDVSPNWRENRKSEEGRIIFVFFGKSRKTKMKTKRDG